jgi:hypothetical protein
LCAAADRASKLAWLTGPVVSPACAALEEFVEVGRNDGQEAQPLEQGHAGALRPVEHPLIEGEDAVVTVEERKHRRCGVTHADARMMTEWRQSGDVS